MREDSIFMGNVEQYLLRSRWKDFQKYVYVIYFSCTHIYIRFGDEKRDKNYS